MPPNQAGHCCHHRAATLKGASAERCRTWTDSAADRCLRHEPHPHGSAEGAPCCPTASPASRGAGLVCRPAWSQL